MSAPLQAARAALRGRRVLVTGHTGFKGGWLVLWLDRLGAEVHGLALPPDQGPDNLFDSARVAGACRSSAFVDVRDFPALAAAVAAARPEVVLHLAAQPLVRRGWRAPRETFDVNVMGTANLLEAVRLAGGARAVVCVTTDKVYDNVEWCWPYRETDPLGGKDPYSASKAAAEMAARAWRGVPGMEACAIATARGGNVIGGGDWSEDRLAVDVARALRDGATLTLRNPEAVRPWQHVMELCLGYMTLAARLLDGRPDRGEDPARFADAFNFGPAPDDARTVAALAEAMARAWGAPAPVRVERAALRESTVLRLDPSRAEQALGWRPVLGFDAAVALTADWYRAYCRGGAEARALCLDQIAGFEALLAPTPAGEPAQP